MAAALAGAPSWAAEPPAAAGGHPGSQTADAGLMQRAAGGRLHEVEGCRLAVQKTRRADAKAWAQLRLADHIRADEEVKRLASSEGAKRATGRPQDKQPVIDHRVGRNSVDGDFLKQVGLSDLKQATGPFENQAGNGADPGIEAWAAATAPMLRARLARAKRLAAGQDGAMRYHRK